MCLITCVKISDKSDKKWEFIAYSSWVVRRDCLQSYWTCCTTCRECWGWGTGLNFFFHWEVLCIIPTMYVLCNMQSRRVRCACRSQWQPRPDRERLSKPRPDRERLYPTPPPPPPAWSELALPSDNSKVGFTGLKVDNLHNRWAYIAVFGLILKCNSHAIP